MKILLTAFLFLFFAGLAFAGEKININTANMEDLTKIVHIGEARALELISLRPFSSLDELTKIKGIGEARLADIKKQGLAQVELNSTESSLTPDETAETSSPQSSAPSPQKELAAAGESLSLAKQSPESLYIFLTAIFTSLFGGAIILMLKKKLKLG